ncbi:hypothetical protein AKJ57_02270 [candidate division MSBL1 archaeon SCGC-AAA259A05]|uniref:Uncharacterized protein n=1 Tax=candidate division MSBL1 archaeon SCGC-AAA259A05 TaxID=1698259 RepID=A0A133UAC5_9EURY|nr:hypothetical protein AKJ57_02270 [candidate division MSBL1 archaeon SCGC-AAA259A05]
MNSDGVEISHLVFVTSFLKNFHKTLHKKTHSSQNPHKTFHKTLFFTKPLLQRSFPFAKLLAKVISFAKQVTFCKTGQNLCQISNFVSKCYVETSLTYFRVKTCVKYCARRVF